MFTVSGFDCCTECRELLKHHYHTYGLIMGGANRNSEAQKLAKGSSNILYSRVSPFSQMKKILSCGSYIRILKYIFTGYIFGYFEPLPGTLQFIKKMYVVEKYVICQRLPNILLMLLLKLC